MNDNAIVVGAGPNGLAAAITLARAGWKVQLYEAKETIGGGARTAELTLPGFYHDVCSAIHPLGIASPFLSSLSLADYGLEWVFPPAALAHPLDDGSALMIDSSMDHVMQSLRCDARAYRNLMAPLVANSADILDEFLRPLPFPPRHPLSFARFAPAALLPASALTGLLFREQPARALFAGLSAHSMLPLQALTSAAYGLVLGMLAHSVGWPVAKGGSQAIVDAMAAYLRSLGGEMITGFQVNNLSDLPAVSTILLDVTPRQLLHMASDRLPPAYQRALRRFCYGPGVFKIDYALSGPIPWRSEVCRQAGTLHLGGTFEEISSAERTVWRGEHPQTPFVLLAQQSLFDPTRAPAGQHTAWAYCHVPNGSKVDMSAAITAQIERFAPGFRDLILAASTCTAAQMEQYNSNYVGGDINGGVQNWRQLFTRPVPRWSPYSTPIAGLYLCSSSTPPGGGVHGMCGYHAALSVLKASGGYIG